MPEHWNSLSESSDSPKAIHACTLVGVVLPVTRAYSPICSSVLLPLMVPDTDTGAGEGVGVRVETGVAVGVGATTVMETVSRFSPRAWSATVETPAEQPRNVVSTKPTEPETGSSEPDSPRQDFFSESPDIARNVAGRSGGL